jgi:hypothetical protein
VTEGVVKLTTRLSVLKKVLVLVLLKDLVSSVLTTFPRLIEPIGCQIYLTMSNAFQDCFQWMSVTEETLFLHDGLIRVIATGPCIKNRLRDVNTICRRSWYIAAHIWKIYSENLKR